jgi:hypothetical protein
MSRADESRKHTIIKLSKADIDSLIQLYDRALVKCGDKSIFPSKPEVVKDSDTSNLNNDNLSEVSLLTKRRKPISDLDNYDTKEEFSLFLKAVGETEYKRFDGYLCR